ncbi:MAG: polymerase [Burkholderiales bacterium]|nr:MAG: polymerase [Burkholderiales bacterium]
MVAGLVLSGLLILPSARAWPQSLLLAALVSLGIAWLQYAGLAAYFSPWIAEAAPGEMLANLRQRNQLATLLVLGWLSLFALSAGRSDLKRLERWLLLACLFAAMLGFGNALSGSRTGLLQWMAVLGLAYLWRRSGGGAWRWLMAAGALGYVLGFLIAPLLAELLGHGNAGLLSRASDSNAFSRLALWSNVLELIAREPLLGHGWRSLAYAHYSSDFSGARFMEMLDNAHNLPLHLAVELGLPVALGFCGLVVWLIWRNKPLAEARADRQLAWGVLMVIGIHSMLEYPLWYGPFFMTAGIAIGVLCGDLWRNWLIAFTDTAQRAIQLGVKALALSLLAGTVFVAFDYHRVSQIYLAPEQRSSAYAADPLVAAKRSVLFPSQAKFAELQITPLSKESAPRVLELSSELVHWSPEPRIIEKLIESSVMMGLDDVAAFHLQRYRVNYPAAHALWSRRVL